MNKTINVYDDYVAKTIKDEVEEYEDFFDKFEPYSESVDECEHKARDGFMPTQDGGFELSAFTTVSHIEGVGISLPEKAQEIMDMILKNVHEGISDSMKSDHPGIVKDDEEFTYSIAEENKLMNEYQDTEMSWQEDDTVVLQMGCFFNDNTKDDTPHRAYAYVSINFEAPYHRRGKMEWHSDEGFDFSNQKELEAGLKKAFKRFKTEI